MRTNHIYFKKAFGIAEVLIASTIIVIVIFALVAAGRSALRGTMYLHERAQATYLAQGAIEGIRQIRDTGWVDNNISTNFDQFVGFASNSSKKRVIRFNAAVYEIIDQSGTNGVIKLDNVDFSRTITFDRASSLLATDGTSPTDVHAAINAVKAIVKVTWVSSGQPKEINVSEVITNWRPAY